MVLTILIEKDDKKVLVKTSGEPSEAVELLGQAWLKMLDRVSSEEKTQHTTAMALALLADVEPELDIASNVVIQ